MRDSILICGNGPSLASHKNLLANIPMATFGCNRLILWNECPFIPTYYACSASAVIKDVEPRNPPYKRHKFMVSRMRDQLEGWTGWTRVYKKEEHDLLENAPTEDILVRGGATMAGIMAQLAAWMGYRELYFVGIEQKGAGHVFDPNGEAKMYYFIPDEDKLFANWRHIKDFYEERGIKLRDCTPDGRLNDILEYQDLSEVLCLSGQESR